MKNLMYFKSFSVRESVDEDSEEYDDIKWALIDFIDQGFDLRIKKYDDPGEIQEMTIAMFKNVDMQLPIVNMIKGSFDAGSFGIDRPNVEGRNREWVESLEPVCLRILDQMGYDHGSFQINQIKAGLGDPNPISRKISVNIHIHLMKNPE